MCQKSLSIALSASIFLNNGNGFLIKCVRKINFILVFSMDQMQQVIPEFISVSKYKVTKICISVLNIKSGNGEQMCLLQT